MTPIEKLRRIADMTALEGVADAIREVADEMDDHAKLLHMIAVRASTFPRYPMGSHLPEVFAAVGMEQPKADVADEMDWRPIETAPPNQTFLAVLDCGGDKTICTMRLPVALHKNSRPNVDFIRERVTHWMPLPPAPKGAE